MNVPTFSNTPDLRADDSKERRTFPYEDVQFAIEQVYDLRSKVLRIALMGTLLHRPDPDARSDPQEQDRALTQLQDDVDAFQKVLALLETGLGTKGIPNDIAHWMSAAASQNTQDITIIREVARLSVRVLQDLQARTLHCSETLKQHRTRAENGFHSAITGICLTLWREYDKDQSLRLVQARDAASTLDNRLNRLERIGTHVRLVSLNASVEASHIGHAGRGLALIAQEFKGLAEEVRTLAQEARGDVNRMLEKD